MNHIAVIFSKNGVRIYHSVDPEIYRGRKDVLIDPILPNTHPHLWTLGKGKINAPIISNRFIKSNLIYTSYLILTFMLGYLIHLLKF